MQTDIGTSPPNFFEYTLFSKPLTDLPPQPLFINTINQYSYCIAQKDARFKRSLQESDVLLPDGIAVVVAMRFLTGEKINKIAGFDAHRYILEDLNKTSGRCFYLGSSESTLRKIKNRLSIEYPNIHVGTYSPPFKAEFNSDDNAQMIKAVNDFSPEVLFVGMTAPKQEKWASENKSKLNVKIICTIGAVFDFYAGTVSRPSKIWIGLGLEWFIRMVKEPRKMWKRYIYYGPLFVYYILKAKIFGNKEKRTELQSEMS